MSAIKYIIIQEKMQDVRLGYVGHSAALRRVGIYTGRTITLDRLANHEKGAQQAAEHLAQQNVADLAKILQYNESYGIRFFRVSSGLFPHMENPKAGLNNYTIDFARPELARVGRIARKYGHRLTMHPGQFTQLGSPDEKIVSQSITDLALHAEIFSAMDLTPGDGSVMIIHGGGAYGNKQETLDRWGKTYDSIPRHTQQFIALENDERQYSVLDLLPVCERYSIPLCPDFFHHQAGHSDKFDIYDKKILARIADTWHKRGIKPKCHWSNQAEGERMGTHSRKISGIPPEIMDFCKTYNADIMCECKDHEECILPLLEQYYEEDIEFETGRVIWTLKK